MVLIADILTSINGAFPIFSFGERHIDEFLEKYPFNEDGIKSQWETFDRLSRNVSDFLRMRFPALGETGRAICCELQMSHLRDKVVRAENSHSCYTSILLAHNLDGSRSDASSKYQAAEKGVFE